MSTTTIDGMPVGEVPLTGIEEVPMWQDGATAKTTAAAIAALNLSAISANTSAVAGLSTTVGNTPQIIRNNSGAAIAIGDPKNGDAAFGTSTLIFVAAPAPLVGGALTITDSRITSTSIPVVNSYGGNTPASSFFAGALTAVVNSGGGSITVKSSNNADVQIIVVSVYAGPTYGGTPATTLAPAYAWDASGVTLTVAAGVVTGVSGYPADLYTDCQSNSWEWGPTGALLEFPPGFPRISSRHALDGIWSAYNAANGTNILTAFKPSERGATQYLPNPLSPSAGSGAVTLSAGTYCLSVINAAVASAGNTLTLSSGTGVMQQGGATQASIVASNTGLYGPGAPGATTQWQSFQVTTAGTFNFSIAGAPFGVQLENNAYPTGFIPIGGYTRAPSYTIAPIPNVLAIPASLTTNAFMQTNFAMGVLCAFGPSVTLNNPAILNALAYVDDGSSANRFGMIGYGAKVYPAIASGTTSANPAMVSPAVESVPYWCVATNNPSTVSYASIGGVPVAGASNQQATGNLACIVFGNDYGSSSLLDYFDGEMVTLQLFNQSFVESQTGILSSLVPQLPYPDPVAAIAASPALASAVTVARANGPLFGAYTGGSFPLAADVMETFLGRHLDFSLDYAASGQPGIPGPLGGSSSQISNMGSLVPIWYSDSGGIRPGSGGATPGAQRNVALGIGICGSDYSLAQVAAGAANAALASTFGALHGSYPGAILRLGWEFNFASSGEYAWGTPFNTVAWIEAFQQVASQARATSMKYTIVWNPNCTGSGGTTIDPLVTYPDGTLVGSISGTALTVTGAPTVGQLLPFAILSGPGIPSGTYIIANGTGTGSVGTYTLNQAATVAGETINYSYVDVVGMDTYANPTYLAPSATGGFQRWLLLMCGARGVLWIMALAKRLGKLWMFPEFGIVNDTDAWLLQRFLNSFISKNNGCFGMGYWMSGSDTACLLAKIQAYGQPTNLVALPYAPANQTITVSAGVEYYAMYCDGTAGSSSVTVTAGTASLSGTPTPAKPGASSGFTVTGSGTVNVVVANAPTTAFISASLGNNGLSGNVLANGVAPTTQNLLGIPSGNYVLTVGGTGATAQVAPYSGNGTPATITAIPASPAAPSAATEFVITKMGDLTITFTGSPTFGYVGQLGLNGAGNTMFNSALAMADTIGPIPTSWTNNNA